MAEIPALTDRVVAFIERSRWSDVPHAVQHDARRALVNVIGTASGAAHDEAIEMLVATLAAFDGPATCRLIGRTERMDALNAAFVNAASANVMDFDDTHHPTVIHPTSPVAPALLALCERVHASGEALVHALAIGIEIACRLGNAVTPAHYVRGWHITSTCGGVGAAAACAKLLDLSAGQTRMALGLAANQACGLVESLGSMAKSVSVGSAARNGLFCALLAQRGYTAAPHTLEGARGFIPVFGVDPEPEALVDGLGERWELRNNAIKPYPSGVVLHPVIDACLDIRSRAPLPVDTIESVHIRGNPLLRQRADRPAPRSGREAAVSAQHTAAVCFLYAEAGVRQYADACVAEPQVQSLGRRVTVEACADIAVEAAAVTVRTTDGRTLEAIVPHALGSLQRPMSDAQLEAKVLELARHAGIAEERTGAWLQAAWRVDRLGDARELIDLLS
jgi:2-methylcitrate dehydratase PrpD